MKGTAAMLAVVSSLLLLFHTATALETADDDVTYNVMEREDASPRFFYFNSSSTATALTLLGALILLGVIFYLVYVGGLLSPTVASSNNYAYNRNDYFNNNNYQNNQDQFRAR